MQISDYSDDVVDIYSKYRQPIGIDMILDKIWKMKILTKNCCIIIHRNKKTKEKFTDKIEVLRSENYGYSKIFFTSIIL